MFLSRPPVKPIPKFLLLSSPHVQTNYSFVARIHVDHTKCGTVDSSLFPVLISGTYSYIRTVANGGNINNTVSSNGQTIPADLGFYSDQACSLPLPFEIASYTATSGQIEAWVQVATLSVSADTVLYMGYGNASQTTDISGFGSGTKPWANNGFQEVLHCQSSVVDSTGNNTPLNSGGLSSGTGQINGGVVGDGVSEFADLGTPAVRGGSGVAWTVAFWANPVAVNVHYTAISYGDNTSNNGWYVELGSTGKWAAPGATDTAAVTAGAWSYIVATHATDNTTTLYRDGVNRASGSFSSAAAATYNAVLGKKSDSGLFFWNGSLDEIKLSTTARSQSWITAEYNNMFSPSTFYTILPPIPVSDTLNISETITRVPSLHKTLNNTVNISDTKLVSISLGLSNSIDLPETTGNIVHSKPVPVNTVDIADQLRGGTANPFVLGSSTLGSTDALGGKTSGISITLRKTITEYLPLSGTTGTIDGIFSGGTLTGLGSSGGNAPLYVVGGGFFRINQHQFYAIDGALVLNAGDSTFDRIDIVTIATPGTSANSNNLDPPGWNWGKATGTPSAVPVAPSVPAGSIGLWQVYVPANATSSTQCTPTDIRHFISAEGALVADHKSITDIDDISDTTLKVISGHRSNINTVDISDVASVSSVHLHHTIPAQITFIGAASTEGTNITIPGAYLPGDLMVIYAYWENGGSLGVGVTPYAGPDLPAGWTSIDTAGNGLSDAMRIGYRFATSSSETSGTWTNATALACAVYRGATPLQGRNEHNVGTNLGFSLFSQGANSWIIAFAGHDSINVNIAQPPTGYITRTSLNGATNSIASYDTGDVATYAFATDSIGGTSAAWITYTLSLIHTDQDLVTVNISETVSKLIQRTKALTDTDNISDITSLSQRKAVPDIYNISDTTSKAIALHKALTNTVSISESASAPRFINETCNISETTLRVAALHPSKSNSVNISNGNFRTDGVFTGGVTTGFGHFNYLGNDLPEFKVAAITARAAGQQGTVPDNFLLSFVVSDPTFSRIDIAVFNTPGVFSGPYGTFDTQIIVGTPSANPVPPSLNPGPGGPGVTYIPLAYITVPPGATDASQCTIVDVRTFVSKTLLSVQKNINDIYAISETVSHAITSHSGIADTNNISELVLRTDSTHRTNNNTLNISETIAKVSTGHKTNNETDNISDSTARFVSLHRPTAGADTDNISETITVARITLVPVADICNISETIAKAIHIVVNIAAGGYAEGYAGGYGGGPCLEISETVHTAQTFATHASVANTDNISETTAKIVALHASVVDSDLISETTAKVTSLHPPVSDTDLISETTTKLIALHKSLSDTDNISEVIATIFTRKFTNSDADNISETTAKLVALYPPVSDTDLISETIANIISLHKALTDTDNISETIIPLVHPIRALSNTDSISETTAKRVTLHPPVLDTLSIGDAIGSVVHLSGTFVVALSLLGSTDTLGGKSSGSAIHLAVGDFADISSISSAVAIYINIHPARSNTINISETITKLITLPIPLSNTDNISDTTAKVISLHAAVTDADQISETAARIIALHRSLADADNISETIIPLVHPIRALSNTVNIVETCIGVSGAFTLESSGLGSTDVLGGRPGIKITLHEPVVDTDALSETTTRQISLHNSLADTDLISEVAGQIITGKPSNNETDNISETVARTVSLHKSLNNSCNISDTRTIALHIAANDTDSISETVTVIAIHLQIATTADTVNISETTAKVIADHKALNETDNISETIARNITLTPHNADLDSLSESVVKLVSLHPSRTQTDDISETTTKHPSGRPTPADALSISESTVSRVGLHESNTDAINISEALSIVFVPAIHNFFATAHNTLNISNILNIIYVYHTPKLMQPLQLLLLTNGINDIVLKESENSFNEISDGISDITLSSSGVTTVTF